MWEKLEKVNIKNKEKYLGLFKNLIADIKSGRFDFTDKENEDYCIVNEIRMDSKFVHLVPKELMELFNELKQKSPDEFLGFTILINNTRVSCFGIPCSELTKAIIG